MHTRRDNPSIPAWREDQLDSLSVPELEAPYFDDALKAWVLSRYADILAAFYSSSLSPASPASDHDSQPSGEGAECERAEGERARLKMRAEAMASLSPAQLRAWRDQFAPAARALAGSLPLGEPVSLT